MLSDLSGVTFVAESKITYATAFSRSGPQWSNNVQLQVLSKNCIAGVAKEVGGPTKSQPMVELDIYKDKIVTYFNDGTSTTIKRYYPSNNHSVQPRVIWQQV